MKTGRPPSKEPLENLHIKANSADVMKFRATAKKMNMTHRTLFNRMLSLLGSMGAKFK